MRVKKKAKEERKNAHKRTAKHITLRLFTRDEEIEWGRRGPTNRINTEHTEYNTA